MADRLLPVADSGGMKYDSGKPRYSLLAPGFVRAVVDVLEVGVKKYAPRSWQAVPNAVERYADALWRHYEAILDGETHDAESGLLHASHLACNAMFLWWFCAREPEQVREFVNRRTMEESK